MQEVLRKMTLLQLVLNNGFMHRERSLYAIGLIYLVNKMVPTQMQFI